MGIFKKNPDKIRANAEAFIDDDEHIQALTCGGTSASLGGGQSQHFVIAATERNVYIIHVHPLGLGTRLRAVVEKTPFAEANVERSKGSFKVNDFTFQEVNFWGKETEALVDYLAAHRQTAT